MFGLSAQYCVRQGASAYLELWAFLLLFAAAAIVLRRTSRILSGTCALFAVLTGIVGGSMFYGCSMTAAAQQGLGTDLPARTFNVLRCLGWEPFGTATGWVILAVECIATVALFTLAMVRWKKAARVLAFIGSALLLALSCASAFFLFFGFSWCTSSRLF
jgi:hypothetical protein